MFTRQRQIDWSSAMRDLSARRVARPDVREEAISFSGLTAWRGASARRYVASVRALDAVTLTGPTVLLAVHRDGADCVTLVTVAAVRSDDALAGFLALARAAGATELHAHTLAADSTARTEVVRDLVSGAAYRPASERAPLATSEGYDRSAIMKAAAGLARARQSVTGETWSVCMGIALRAAWAAARALRARQAH